jgi:hypothetical protein
VSAGKVIGGELGRDTAPREAESGAQHRHVGPRAVEDSQQVRQHAGDPQPDQHEGEGDVVAVRSAAIRGAQPRADDAQDDRAHRLVLAPPGVLAEHPLAQQHEHQQAGGQSRLHHRQGRQH